MSWEAAGTRQQHHAPLTISVLPAHVAYDYEHMANSLLDPELLAGAIAIRVFRAPLLAIPVGGRRRGGTLSVNSVPVGEAIAAVLSGLHGFPDVRLTVATEPVGGYAVEWGEPLPACLPRHARHEFYGIRGPADYPSQDDSAGFTAAEGRLALGASLTVAEQHAVRREAPARAFVLVTNSNRDQEAA
ncbi:DUF6302 family protein [Streptomyces polygonati]|uniref:DUF6302 family protein n=1 Tax=Streptomyces polygonati TaxID=1617087 RepID=A0ABV8HXJ3_9ACTN